MYLHFSLPFSPITLSLSYLLPLKFITSSLVIIVTATHKIHTHTQSAVSSMYYPYICMFRADCLRLDNLPEGYTLEKTDFPFLCNHQLLVPLHLGLRVLWNFPHPHWHISWYCHFASLTHGEFCNGFHLLQNKIIWWVARPALMRGYKNKYLEYN